MPMKLQVTRELYLAAPEGLAVYAQNPSYTQASGATLVEAVKHEALYFPPGAERVYYHALIYRRYSADNGRSWRDGGVHTRERPDALDGEQRHMPLHTLLPGGAGLLSLHARYEVRTREDMFFLAGRRARTYRLFYELSHDGGATWTPARQVIDERPGHDATHWGPNLHYGYSGAAIDLAAPLTLADGTVLFGLTLTNAPLPGTELTDPRRGGRYGVAWLRARWDVQAGELRWQVGEPIFAPPGASPRGTCEPSAMSPGGEEVFTAMRCQGHAATGIPSTRYTAGSQDGGRTWDAPVPLRYDDGSPVWTPASLASFIYHPPSGQHYFLANIVPGPVTDQMPRYPLCLARFDAARRVVLRDSVTVIQDRPPQLPEQVRYTNWGSYIERGSGDLILTLPEQPKLMDFSAMTRAQDFTADCLRYRIRLPV